MKRDKCKEQLLEQLRKTPIVEIACSRAGVGRTTFYRWKKEDPEFAKACDEAMRDGQGLISDVAESQLIAAIKEGHITAIMYWLKHHHNDYHTRVELNGIIHAAEELSPEQTEVACEAFRLAGLPEINKQINEQIYDQLNNTNSAPGSNTEGSGDTPGNNAP